MVRIWHNFNESVGMEMLCVLFRSHLQFTHSAFQGAHRRRLAEIAKQLIWLLVYARNRRLFTVLTHVDGQND